MQTYTFRRNLGREEWMKAIGIAAGAGVGTALLVGYLARIVLQRTPLSETSSPPKSAAARP